MKWDAEDVLQSLQFYRIIFSLVLSLSHLIMFFLYRYGFGTSVVAFFPLFSPQIALVIGVLTSRYIKGEYSLLRCQTFLFLHKWLPLASGWVDLCMCWSAMVAGWKIDFPARGWTLHHHGSLPLSWEDSREDLSQTFVAVFFKISNSSWKFPTQIIHVGSVVSGKCSNIFGEIAAAFPTTSLFL